MKEAGFSEFFILKNVLFNDYNFVFVLRAKAKMA
jgi:hypothetical protein